MTAPARIFDMAAATLAARGAAIPEHWTSGAPPARIDDDGSAGREPAPRAAVAAAAARAERPEAAAHEEPGYLRGYRRRAATQRAAERITATLGAGLADTGKASPHAVFRALVEIALDQAQQRAYRAAPSQVTFMLGVELMGWAFGVSQPTMWRRLEALRAAGLVDTRRWYTRVDGVGRTAGTLFSVRLMAGRARVHHEALAATWRDLQADIEHGRTWRRERLNALETPEGDREATEYLRTRALPPATYQAPVTVMHSDGPAPADLAELFDLPGLARQDRSERVDAVSLTLAATMRDHKSRNLYRWVVWQALRLADQGQAQYLAALHDTARRVQANMREGNGDQVKRAGAVFVAQLRETGVWDALKAAPQTRVGAAA